MTDQEMMEQFQMIMGGMASMEDRIKNEMSGIKTELQQGIAGVHQEVKDSETRVKLYIENEVSSKIASLFDGYKSALENQAILEITNKALNDKLERMEMRIAALEDRIA